MESAANNQCEIEPNSKVAAEIATFINFSTDFHIFDTKWLPTFPVKFVTVGATSKSSSKGFIQISEINDGKLAVERTLERQSAFRCATFDATVRNTSLSLGNFHGQLQIFDIEKCGFPIFDEKAHDGVVNCLDGIGSGNGSEIVTGGQDGCINVWDPRQGGPVVSIAGVRKESGGNGSRDCWTVTFGDGSNQDDRIVCAGYDNGDIKVIDLKNLNEKWSCNVGSGVCKISCDRKSTETNRLIAGTVDGKIHLFDTKNYQLEPDNALRVSESSSVWSVNYLPQNDQIFASVGDSVKIWRHSDSSQEKESPDLLAQLELSSAGVNCFDWNPDFSGLGLCGSFDQHIRLLITCGL
ncbi:Dynein axonemal assembly factor 10 [Pseudolycoriella hygida]|uniref:Dynein axonemal assembly factor 10 n=1 Tax=Pseudolycoriella hygida TaxID=35572 RepID=A0A9Q0N8F3_9DIPT|nr:Dynein axonemal assembly factor 10 [Pseudolycoriella hygida]